MKSIKQQYIDLREGNMSQANFMRNLRMTLPQYITNVTSYDDSVRILRNKGILTEADITMSKDTLNKIKKVIGDITAKNDDYHRDGYTMGFFEGDGEDEEGTELSEMIDPNDDDIPAIYKRYNSDAWVDAQKDAGESDYDDEDMYNDLKADDYRMNQLDDYDADYEEPSEPFDMAESLNEAKDPSSEGKWKTVTGKDLYAHFKEIDNLNAQEVLIGIDYEMQKNEDLTKAEAAKIVVKNLKKNPIYYTAEDMSGVEGYEPETMGPKADIEARQMQYLDKNMGNVVDKKMGMKPVKDVEKVKKDSDKGGVSNKAVKNIELMSLIAKTVRGLKKMDATGEKMKKISIKEADLTKSTSGLNSLKTSDAAKRAKKIHDEEEKKRKAKNSSLKEQLKELIRKEIAGVYGGDAMDAEDGTSYIKELIRFYDDEGNPIHDEEGKPGVVVKSKKK